MTAQSTQEEANRRFDEDLVSRLRDRLLNQQYWSDEEAWLRNATWLALPAYYHATLETVLNKIGIDDTPFARLNSWLPQEGIRDPRGMSRRLDDADLSDRDTNEQGDDELNSRIEYILGNSGLLPELRSAAEAGLSNRRRRDPQPQDTREDTCIICWERIRSRRCIRHSRKLATMRTHTYYDGVLKCGLKHPPEIVLGVPWPRVQGQKTRH